MASPTGIPAFRKLANELRAQIEGGELPAGAQLPSMSQLRESHAVSSTVVRDALNELRNDGLIVGQQGKGIYVADPIPQPRETSEPSNFEQRLDELERRVADLERRPS